MSFLSRLLCSAFFAGTVLAAMPFSAAAAVVFQSTPVPNGTSGFSDARAPESTAVGRMSVSSSQDITGIGVLNFLPADQNLKFFIADAGTGDMLYLSMAQLFSADTGSAEDVGSMTYKLSELFSFTLEPGIIYAVGSISDGSTWTYADYSQTNTSEAFTSYLLNVNVDSFSTPALSTSLNCCSIGFLLSNDQAIPEPAAFALLGMGLAGLGAVRRRRRA